MAKKSCVVCFLEINECNNELLAFVGAIYKFLWIAIGV